MLDKKHDFPGFFRLRAVDIARVGKGAAGTGGQHNHDAEEPGIEKLFLQTGNQVNHAGRVIPAVKPVDRQKRRGPAAGGKVVQEPDQNGVSLFHVSANWIDVKINGIYSQFA